MTRTALITGCSSGIGRATVLRLHDEGWNVIATMRRPEVEQELTELDRVCVTRLDVTDQANIEAAVAQGLGEFGSIEHVVCNAGAGAQGMFELFTDAEARTVYDTNVFGTMNVVRAVLPHMRERRRGTIVVITSVAALVGSPGATIYSASKFALNGFAEALSMEVSPWGINVHTIAPGAFPTNFLHNANDAWDRGEGELGDISRRFGAHMDRLIDRMKTQGGAEADTIEVANKILECVAGSMPLHNVVGVDAEQLASSLESIPREDFLRGMRSHLPKLDGDDQ